MGGSYMVDGRLKSRKGRRLLWWEKGLILPTLSSDKQREIFRFLYKIKGILFSRLYFFTHMVLRPFAIFLLCLAPTLAFAAVDIADVELVPYDSKLPLQGVCNNQEGNADYSTALCSGEGVRMVDAVYDHNYRYCFYANNERPDRKSLFLPMKTLKEFDSFLTVSTPLRVDVVYACPKTRVEDECGQGHMLPDAPYGTKILVRSSGTFRQKYECMPSSLPRVFCGTWVEKSSKGLCNGVAECGSSHKTSSTDAPHSDLCASGDAGPVERVDNRWIWNCMIGGDEATATSCFARIEADAKCGDADGERFSSAPSSGLCAEGQASSVQASNNGWAWRCTRGNDTASCAARATRDGKCGSSDGRSLSRAPAFGLCKNGEPSRVRAVDNKWVWSCTVDNDNNTEVDCQADIKKDGRCGVSDGGDFRSAPHAGLCRVGEASQVSQQGNKWKWTCGGENGGNEVACAAEKKDEFNNCSPRMGEECHGIRDSCDGSMPIGIILCNGKCNVHRGEDDSCEGGH